MRKAWLVLGCTAFIALGLPLVISMPKANAAAAEDDESALPTLVTEFATPTPAVQPPNAAAPTPSASATTPTPAVATPAPTATPTSSGAKRAVEDTADDTRPTPRPTATPRPKPKSQNLGTVRPQTSQEPEPEGYKKGTKVEVRGRVTSVKPLRDGSLSAILRTPEGDEVDVRIGSWVTTRFPSTGTQVTVIGLVIGRDEGRDVVRATSVNEGGGSRSNAPRRRGPVVYETAPAPVFVAEPMPVYEPVGPVVVGPPMNVYDGPPAAVAW